MNYYNRIGTRMMATQMSRYIPVHKYEIIHIQQNLDSKLDYLIRSML